METFRELLRTHTKTEKATWLARALLRDKPFMGTSPLVSRIYISTTLFACDVCVCAISAAAQQRAQDESINSRWRKNRHEVARARVDDVGAHMNTLTRRFAYNTFIRFRHRVSLARARAMHKIYRDISMAIRSDTLWYILYTSICTTPTVRICLSTHLSFWFYFACFFLALHMRIGVAHADWRCTQRRHFHVCIMLLI